MNNANNTAPVMVELSNDQMVMNRSMVQTLLEQTLNLRKNVDEKNPFDGYRSAMSNAIDYLRFDKNSFTDKEKIKLIQERVSLVDLYFNEFVVTEPVEAKEEVLPITNIPQAKGVIDLRRLSKRHSDVDEDIF